MIGIIDYGMGNLRSVQKALEFLHFKADIIQEQEDVSKYDKIILPGVGAFSDAIRILKQNKMDAAIHRHIQSGKPFLGICIGMQLLFDISYENGEHKGLCVFKGSVNRLENVEKVPHIGWNSLELKKNQPLFKNLKNPFVYFVHSYYVQTEPSIVSAITVYGKEFAAAIQHENVMAVQFHPEKSGDIGLEILKNFGGI